MKLDQIGFYTLTDERARSSSVRSPIRRAELLLTGRCNLRCKYCRGVNANVSGHLPYDDALSILGSWCACGLKAVRFSGGEPTLYQRLVDLVALSKDFGVDRVAVSSNGTACRDSYDALLRAGADDFSISLDSCCSATNDRLAGIGGTFDQVCETLRWLSSRCYVTVGVVLTPENESDVEGTIRLAHGLGVADIRLIPTVGVSGLRLANVSSEILDAHPILKYRIASFRSGRDVRGLLSTDSCRCRLVLDDVHAAGRWHYPCVIYFRERGLPVGQWSFGNWRQDREKWSFRDTHEDPICRSQCLDVCREYNNRAEELATERAAE